jgi:hypothetical protein
MQQCNSRRVAPGDVAQPVSRQPDVTGHHGTELPEHPLGASFRVSDDTLRIQTTHPPQGVFEQAERMHIERRIPASECANDLPETHSPTT